MTTLAEDTPLVQVSHESIAAYPMIAAGIIYRGAAVGLNSSGYARPLVAGDKFVGFCTIQADNSTGAAADASVTVLRSGIYKLTVSGVAITDVGKAVYASDDATFTLAKGVNALIGHVTAYSAANTAYVEFDAGNGLESYQELGTVAMTVGAAVGDVITVAIQAYDRRGAEMAKRCGFYAYLSDDANGDTVTAASGALAVAAGTDGALLITGSADNGFEITTESDGDADVAVTLTNEAGTFYLVCRLPNGSLVASSAITFTS